MTKGIDTIISKIEKIAEKKAEEIEQLNYVKYKEVYDMVIRFLKREKILLYGGFAINELMPASLKIYKDMNLPDIDFFTYKPKEIAAHLVKRFQKAGFDTSSFSEALHPGTYKVFVHGLQVADITGVTAKAFRRLSRNSVRGPAGLPVVDPQYLRMTLHVLMSQANDSHRWSKVFARLIAFYKVYPPSRDAVCKTRTVTEEERNVEDFLYDAVKKEKYVLFGSRELRTMMPEHAQSAPSKLPIVQCLCDPDPDIVATNLAKEYEKHAQTTLLTVKTFAKDDFMPKHAIVFLKHTPIAGFYQTGACITFNEVQGTRIASIHTMLRMYLSMTFSPLPHFERAGEDLECITSMLSALQQNVSKYRRRRILQEFVSECYGVQPGLVTLRRDMLIRRM